MKKYFFLLTLAFATLIPLSASAATWKPATPPGFTPITWVSGYGIASFIRAPENSGYIDYLTIIHLPSTQIKLVSSPAPRTQKGPAAEPFTSSTAENWSFTRSMVESLKAANQDVRFLWNVPFFNITNLTTDLSLSLKSSDADGAYITSGSRPDNDIAQARRMLIIDNKTGTGKITDFDEAVFVKEGDQAVEGFHPLGDPSVKVAQTERLYLGVRADGSELVVYCSKSASYKEASNALLDAGVPLENQMQADGGGSATCAYNLPGQYFVEPGRALPHVMGAVPVVLRGKTTIDKLNVRSGPGASNKSVRQLPLGTELTAYEEKNGWLRINQENEWVSASYVKKAVTIPYSGTITINQLNVRSGAGTSFGVTRKLAIGTTIQVLEEKNGWVRISPTEWISAQYIK